MTKEDACRICCKTVSVEMFRLSDPSFDGSRTTAQVIEDCFGLSVCFCSEFLFVYESMLLHRGLFCRYRKMNCPVCIVLIVKTI